jgi:hypothetical protein
MRFILLLGLALFSAAAAQQPARDRDPDRGTAIIRGTVVAADTGGPVRRAQIRASAPQAPLARFATTDDEGRYELLGLPAGTWSLTASKGGFATRRYGQRRDNQIVDPIDLADGQRIVDADFVLPRGGVLAGRVSDEFGEPAAGIRVQVLRSQLTEGRRRLVPVGAITDQTDDTGSFRLYGLAPGDYFVVANFRGGIIDPGTGPPAYAPTYFPGTVNIAEAQRIPIGGGQEQLNINFPLLTLRTVLISGTAVSSSGEPLANGMAMLANVSPAGAASIAVGSMNGQDVAVAPATILPDGRFHLTDIAPGSYVLTVYAGVGRANPQPEVGSMPVTVGTTDLTGITVTTNRGATVTGAVAVEGGIAGPELGDLRVVARVQGAAGQGGFARVSNSGTFRHSALMGSYVFGVDGLPAGWMMKSITFDGTDVTDRTVELTGEQQIRAQVVITNRVLEVNGRAMLRGQPLRDFAVVVFAEDAARWTYPTRYVRAATGDTQGRFTIRGLPPGERYRAIALDYLEEGEAGDPEFLTRLRDAATPFSLREDENRTLDLEIVER